MANTTLDSKDDLSKPCTEVLRFGKSSNVKALALRLCVEGAMESCGKMIPLARFLKGFRERATFLVEATYRLD